MRDEKREAWRRAYEEFVRTGDWEKFYRAWAAREGLDPDEPATRREFDGIGW